MTMNQHIIISKRFTIKIMAGILFCLFTVFPEAHTYAGPALFEQSTLTISLSDPDSATDDLIAKAQSLDGYFTYLADQSVTFRIPSSKSAGFLAYCETKGIVLEKQFETTGFDEQLDQKRTSLKAKQEILDRYLAVLKNAKKKTIVSVERAVQEVASDIETLKGSITYMEHELAFAKIIVQFQFKDRTAPVYSGTSSFPWLNTMNLQTMIEDFNDEK